MGAGGAPLPLEVCHTSQVMEGLVGRERLELVKPPLNREHAICCGGGGRLQAFDFSLSEKIAGSKINEFTQLGVDEIVTGYPACVLSLRQAARAMGGPEVHDLSEILHKCV